MTRTHVDELPLGTHFQIICGCVCRSEELRPEKFCTFIRTLVLSPCALHGQGGEFERKSKRIDMHPGVPVDYDPVIDVLS